MKKISLSVLFGVLTFTLGFFLARCAHSSATSSPIEKRTLTIAQPTQPTMKIITAKSSDFPSKPPELLFDTLAAAPQKLFRGDLLTLTFKMPHGTKMAIKDPDENLFMVCFDKEISPLAQPLLDSTIFQETKLIAVTTAEVKGTLDFHQTQPVFNKTGWYTIFTSTNFESCDFQYDGKIRVYYSNTAHDLPKSTFH